MGPLPFQPVNRGAAVVPPDAVEMTVHGRSSTPPVGPRTQVVFEGLGLPVAAHRAVTGRPFEL